MQLRNGKIIDYNLKVKVIRKSKSGVPQLSLPVGKMACQRLTLSPRTPPSPVNKNKPNLSVVTQIYENWRKAIPIAEYLEEMDLKERICVEIKHIIGTDLMNSTSRMLNFFLYFNSHFEFMRRIPELDKFVKVHVVEKIKEQTPVMEERLDLYKDVPSKRVDYETLLMLKNTMEISKEILKKYY